MRRGVSSFLVLSLCLVLPAPARSEALAARTPADLLAALAAVDPARGRPVVDLHLTSGAVLTGIVLGHTTAARGGGSADAVALGLLGTSGYAPGGTVAHLPVSAVLAVGLRDGARVGALLDGRLATLAPPPEPPSSRLALARTVSEAGAALGQRLGLGFEVALDRARVSAEPEALSAALAAAEGALAALEALAEDPLGHEALSSVARVEIGLADVPAAVRSGPTLRLDLPAGTLEPFVLRTLLAEAL